MRPLEVAVLVIALYLAVATGLSLAGESSGDRMFVLVSPLEVPGPSSIVAFDIDMDGVPVQGESYATGGDGRVLSSPQAVVVDPGGRFAFAANNESDSVAVFAVQPDGRLEPVSGSPFIVGSSSLTYSPFFLEPTPDASFLYVSALGALVAYQVSDNGALDAIQSIPRTMAELATSPKGDFLFAAGIYTETIHSYRITTTGILEEVDGSPFGYDASRPYRVVVSEDGSRLWVLDLDTGIAAFAVGDDGSLQLTGQTAVGEFSIALESAAEDRFLYAAPPYEPEVRGFESNGAAPVTLPGSPFPAEYTGSELLASPDGTRLYQVTAELASVLPMAIDLDGGLTPLDLPVPVETPDESVPNGATYFARVPSVVAIDVRPGSDRNPIQIGSRGVIPVAILGSTTFDVADVDQASVRLGPEQAIPAHRLPHRTEDFDDDGDQDLVLHFRTEATGIACGQTSVELVGLTFDGREFSARDSIAVLGCRDSTSRSASRHGARRHR